MSSRTSSQIRLVSSPTVRTRTPSAIVAGERRAEVSTQRTCHGVEALDVHTDDAVTPPDFSARADAGGEPTASDRNDDDIGTCVEELPADRPLPCDDGGIVEGREESPIVVPRQPSSVLLRLLVGVAVTDDVGAERFGPADLRARSADGHHGVRTQTKTLRGPRHPRVRDCPPTRRPPAGDLRRPSATNMAWQSTPDPPPLVGAR